MKRTKQTISLLLAALLTLGVLLPGFGARSVFAAPSEEEATVPEEDTTAPEEEETTAPEEDVPAVLGDADRDGAVTAGDARLVLRCAVGLEAQLPLALCDTDEDGRITAADARDVLRLAVGLPIGEAERIYEAEQASRRAEEESRKAAEEESRRLEEASRKAAEEESRRLEEESRKAAEEESRKAAEEESRRAEEEASRKAEEDAENAKQEKAARREKWLASFPDAISYDDLADNMDWMVNGLGVRSWWNSTQNAAGNSIYNRLSSYGYGGSDLKKLDFYRDGVLGRNVMAVIPTKEKNPDILLIVSHYDTARGTGGAVDNASGAVALLQLAKRFKYAEEDFGLELRFLFTAGEEQGYYGAYAYVWDLTAAERDRHVCVFNMDMAGKPNNAYEPGRAYYLCVSTEPVSTDGYYSGAARDNAGSRALNEAKRALGDLGEDGWYCPVRAGVHDIVPFRKAGMPALTLSWRCIASQRSSGADYGLASPYFIHSAADNLTYFHMRSLYNTTRLAAAAVARLILPYTAH